MIRALLFAFLTAAISPAQVTYKIRLTANEGNRLVELSSEQYVADVLAGESSVFRSDEALKAMAIAARTYAARMRGRHANEGFDFCSTTHCQRVDLRGVTNRVSKATESTTGELLWFKGKPAFAVYSRNCGGYSEDVGAVWPDVDAPYLRAHSDLYCSRNGEAGWNWASGPDEIAKALLQSHLRAPEPIRKITVTTRTASGRAKMLELLGSTSAIPISASSFRFAVDRALGWNCLRSDFYRIDRDGAFLRFHGTGEGHGVGMCQVGADEMGLEGRAYREILAFYYPGTTVGRSAAGFEWTRLGGEHVAILTTNPDRDSEWLPLADGIERDVSNRLNWSLPRSIEIRVYPNLDTFRNATGEPGWVAARTSGYRIDVQPFAVLEQHGALEATLRHELLHVLIESQATPGLPVWFREGLVEWLNQQGGADHRASWPAIFDGAIRQRQNRQQAQQAYAASKARVASLIDRYGEGVVLAWLKAGLPAELKNSSDSSPATNSK